MATLEMYANAKVSCHNEDLGCPWKGLLKDLHEHGVSCDKKLFRNAIIDIGMLKGRLEQKDREINFLKNNFALKIENISKSKVVKKKEKLEKIRNQTEKIGEIVLAQVEEIREENAKKNEEIEILKKEVEELRSEIKDLKKEDQKCSEEVNKGRKDHTTVSANENKSEPSSITQSTELQTEVPQNPSVNPQTTTVFFDMAIKDVNIGRIVVNLYVDKAPNTCRKFIELCNHEKGVGYKGSMVCSLGDDHCTMGKWKNLTYPTGHAKKLPAEYITSLENLADKHDRKGLVTMWESKSGTMSVFAILLKPLTKRDGKNVIIGNVREDSWHVVEEIAKQPISNFTPIETISITDCGVLV